MNATKLHNKKYYISDIIWYINREWSSSEVRISKCTKIRYFISIDNEINITLSKNNIIKFYENWKKD